ncbi:hypothetical protein QZH56_22800 [Streptomyces olivoreticuli]|uniref:hypothetical protein n=1 Tax=Streptomyces olivoreticuli TaxID=68246 RepID=UPI00265B1226|nr:hypothetical protein [Streptomyces olivoreticuli]WKK21670.1 hypothetical protein QZH56_22800 [Streptomyces olivoreticuli]
MTTTPATAQSVVVRPEPVVHHWIMTVQTANGMQGTYDGPISVVPGVDTRTSSYTEVRAFLAEQMGTERLTVLFFALEPDAL